MADVAAPSSKAPVPGKEHVSGGSLVSRLQSLLRRSPRKLNGEQVEAMIGQELELRRSFSHAELFMLSRLLEFGRARVEDAMVPRADIIAVELGTPLEELVQVFERAAHSRLPVYRGTLDDPVGMVHIKDVLPYLSGEMNAAETPPFSLDGIKRNLLFVPPSMPAGALLLKMQTTRIHMALVIDEYGGTDGLVTIEDLVELIVGDIEDEHDVDESPQIVPAEDGSYVAHARVEIGDLAQVLGAGVDLTDSDDDIDTLGGLVFSLVGRVPQRGEIVSHPAGWEFEVMDADPRRIKRVRIRKAAKRKPARRRPPGTAPTGNSEMDRTAG